MFDRAHRPNSAISAGTLRRRGCGGGAEPRRSAPAIPSSPGGRYTARRKRAYQQSLTHVAIGQDGSEARRGHGPLACDRTGRRVGQPRSTPTPVRAGHSTRAHCTRRRQTRLRKLSDAVKSAALRGLLQAAPLLRRVTRVDLCGWGCGKVGAHSSCVGITGPNGTSTATPACCPATKYPAAGSPEQQGVCTTVTDIQLTTPVWRSSIQIGHTPHIEPHTAHLAS